MDEIFTQLIKSRDLKTSNSLKESWIKGYQNQFLDITLKNANDAIKGLKVFINSAKKLITNNEQKYIDLISTEMNLIDISTDILKSFKFKKSNENFDCITSTIECLCGNNSLNIFNGCTLRQIFIKLKEEDIIVNFNKEQVDQCLKVIMFDLFINFKENTADVLNYFQKLVFQWGEVFKMCVYNLSNDQLTQSLVELQNLYE